MANFVDKLVNASKITNVPNDPIYFFWIGSSPTLLNVLSLKSYLYHGHHPVLYLYRDFENIPAGVEVRDANEIVPYSDFEKLGSFREYRRKLFSKKDAAINNEKELDQACHVFFSNYFRNQIIYKHGGWWSDLDIICLRHYDFEDPYVFAGQSHSGIPSINNCIFKCPPQDFTMQELIRQQKEALESEVTNIPYFGVVLFSELIHSTLKMTQFVQPYHVFQPIKYEHLNDVLKDTPIPDSSYAIHLFTNTFIWHHNPNGEFEPNSLLERLKKRYL